MKQSMSKFLGSLSPTISVRSARGKFGSCRSHLKNNWGHSGRASWVIGENNLPATCLLLFTVEWRALWWWNSKSCCCCWMRRDCRMIKCKLLGTVGTETVCPGNILTWLEPQCIPAANKHIAKENQIERKVRRSGDETAISGRSLLIMTEITNTHRRRSPGMCLSRSLSIAESISIGWKRRSARSRSLARKLYAIGKRQLAPLMSTALDCAAYWWLLDFWSAMLETPLEIVGYTWDFSTFNLSQWQQWLAHKTHGAGKKYLQS